MKCEIVNSILKHQVFDICASLSIKIDDIASIEKSSYRIEHVDGLGAWCYIAYRMENGMYFLLTAPANNREMWSLVQICDQNNLPDVVQTIKERFAAYEPQIMSQDGKLL